MYFKLLILYDANIEKFSSLKNGIKFLPHKINRKIKVFSIKRTLKKVTHNFFNIKELTNFLSNDEMNISTWILLLNGSRYNEL